MICFNANLLNQTTFHARTNPSAAAGWNLRQVTFKCNNVQVKIKRNLPLEKKKKKNVAVCLWWDSERLAQKKV